MRPALLAAAALTVLTPMSAGCGLLGITINGKPIGGGPVEPKPYYQGPECQGVALDTRSERIGLDHRHPQTVRQAVQAAREDAGEREIVYAEQPAADAVFGKQAAHVVCAERLSGQAAGRHGFVARLHDRFDAFEFDHARAAVILTACSKLQGCLLDAKAEDATQNERWTAGLLAFYAANVDPAKVASALAASGASEGFQAAFTERLDEAVAITNSVLEVVPDDEAAIFVDTPAAVRAEDEAHFKAFAEQWRGLRTLAAVARAERAEGVSDDTVGKLEELRRQYVKACGAAPECVHDGLSAAVAHELFLAHVSRGDSAAAMGEADLTEATGPRGRPAALEIFRRQAELLSQAKRARAKTEDAQRRGLDAETAAALGGAPDFEHTHPWRMDEVERLQYAAVVPGRVNKTSGKVKATKKLGDGMTKILFADDVKRYADEACRDTNRVERIGPDGRVQYGQRCRKTGKVNVYRRTFDPVVVPSNEAARLKSGDKVMLWTVGGEPKKGRVRWVHRNERLVLVRDVPVKGKARKQ